MLKRYISLFLFLSIYTGTRCAEPHETPKLDAKQVAFCLHLMEYLPQNLDTIAASIAHNLFERYPGVTKKELVGLFRWADAKRRQRSCVLPLPMIQLIWQHIEALEATNNRAHANISLQRKIRLICASFF
jgi:hypothetical protein